MPDTTPEERHPDPGRRILVTGASGFIGRHLVAALSRRGDHVVALVRDAARFGISPGVEVVEGDVTDPDAAGRAVDGVDAVVHLAAATSESQPDVARRVNVDASRTLAEAARRAGVRRFVAVSSIAVHRQKLGPYAATKREMERVLAESGLDVVILRPSLVYGPGSRGLFRRMVDLVSGLPLVPVIGRGLERTQPLHVDDLVRAILFCLDDARVVGNAYDLVGPDDVTIVELLRGIERTQGLRKRHVHVPRPVALAAASAMALVTKHPPITKDNVLGAGQATPFDPEPARRDLPAPRVTLRDGLPTLADPGPDGAATDPLVRVVVAGLGRMGITHSALLSVVPGVRVAGAVDVDPRLGKALRGMGFDVPWFASLDDAIEAVRPHAAVIATPNQTHETLALAAANEGVGVLVEKPLANDLGSARRIAAAIRTAGVTASCGYVLAYLPTFERAKDILVEGALGPLASFESSMFLSQVFGPKQGWLYDPHKAGGGVLPNVTSHLLFLLRWYFGQAGRIAATARRIHTAVDDEASLSMTFPGGLEGTVETSWSIAGFPQSVTAIRIRGRNGTLEVDNAELVLTLDEPAAGFAAGPVRIHAADLPQPERYHLVREGFSREGEDFIRAIRARTQPRTSMDLALDVQAMMDAAYRSSDQGGEAVKLRPAQADGEIPT